MCSHPHDRSEVQEGARTGKAKVPKPLGAGSRFSEIQVKWGEVGGHGEEIPYEKQKWMSYISQQEYQRLRRKSSHVDQSLKYSKRVP